MPQREYNKLNSLVRDLFTEKDRYKSLNIAIKVSNEFMRILFPEDERGEVWSESLRVGDDALDRVIPASNFPNQKVESWFEKHPYLGGERTAIKLFDAEDAPIESKFYWLNKSSAKSRIAAGVMLSPNWEDGDLFKGPEYKVGIDFFMTSNGDSLLVAISNEGKLRVLELNERLRNTQIDILHNIDGVAGLEGTGGLMPQAAIHKTLWDAFALKTVNKLFYEGISTHFNMLLQYLLNVSGKEQEEAKLFTSRLLGRLLFVWFLKKKGFINADAKYFECTGISASDYYDTRLKPLFFDTLNKPQNERECYNDVYDLSTPFLNGGLFEPRENDWVDEKIDFPPDWFESLFKHFEEFNFTTDESTPEYEQVAIDPEMLGRVFENLLATQLDETGKEARKSSGSFYTPREIVSYMCRESLRQYLYESLEKESYRDGIDKLLDMPDHEFEIKHSDAKKSLWGTDRTAGMTKKTVEALNKLRVVDPACGSGAFPMGMLQLLIKTYARLGLQKNPYDLKIQILGNNIYGVDIQPMAIEISRLRAWLSLIVDEKNAKNVRPLPNLEFRFVCANTLVPLIDDIDSEGQMSMFSLWDDESTKELDQIMHEYYKADNSGAKDKLRSEYVYAIEKIQNSNSEIGDRLKQRMKWDPFDLSLSAEFFDSEIMFNVKDGFDIVIGNPPYIQLQSIRELSANLYKPLGYETYESTGDIYALFYERGFDLLHDNGVLCYITSNKWMRANYGRSLRNYFLENTNPVCLIDFAGTKVFESATVDVNILLSIKNPDSGNFDTSIVRDDCSINLSDYVKQHTVKCSFSEDESWTILSPIEQSIKRKIEAVGIPLKEWDININYGIKTGCNDAFIIDGVTKDRLIAEDPKSAEIIRPILRGKDIKRYSYEFADKWLIATFPAKHYDIDNYPAVKHYLQAYGERRLAQTGEKDIGGIKGNNARKKTTNKWFETQDTIAYWDDFSKQKIVWGNLCLSPQFTIVEKDYYLNAPSAMIVPGNKYILAILNSVLGDWYIRQLGVTRNGGYFEYKPMFIEQMPVPQIDIANQQPFTKIVDEILAGKRLGTDTSQLESHINQMAYRLYAFTEEEISYLNLIAN